MTELVKQLLQLLGPVLMQQLVQTAASLQLLTVLLDRP
jgi:hypothetical protein